MTSDELQTYQFALGIFAQVVGVASLVALIVYVVKTWHIAGATARAAAATEAAATATAQSARVSERVLAEMQQAREFESAPYVIAYFDIPPSAPLVYVVAKNIGRSAARDVRLEFDPPIISKLSSGEVSTLPTFLTDGVPFMPPDFEMRSILWSALDVFRGESGIPQGYKVTVSYTDSKSGKQHSESYVLDFSAFRETVYTSQKTVNDIHGILKELSKQQAAVAHSAKAIAETLSRGIMVTNGSLLVDNLQVNIPPEKILRTKLLEVLAVWQRWRARDENERYTSVNDLLPILRALRNQLQRAVVDGADHALRLESERCDRILTELLAHRFYADGGASYRRFEETGDTLLALSEVVRWRDGEDSVSDMPKDAPEDDRAGCESDGEQLDQQQALDDGHGVRAALPSKAAPGDDEVRTQLGPGVLRRTRASGRTAVE
jgi:hypothetical protein